MYDFRTDLAVERSEIYKRKNNLSNIDGMFNRKSEKY